jgi:hypothetical protein
MRQHACSLRGEEAAVKSVVGPCRRRRRDRRACACGGGGALAPSARRGGDLSARQFAVIAFVVWAGCSPSSTSPWDGCVTQGELLVHPIGAPEPPHAILPDNTDLRRSAPPAPRVRSGRTTLPAARGPVAPAVVALGEMIIPGGRRRQR